MANPIPVQAPEARPEGETLSFFDRVLRTMLKTPPKPRKARETAKKREKPKG
jgi:hypothetical protein